MYEAFRVTLHTNPPTDMNDANQYMDNVLGAWIHDRYAICSQQNYVNSPLCIDIQLRYDNGVPLIANLATIGIEDNI